MASKLRDAAQQHLHRQAETWLSAALSHEKLLNAFEVVYLKSALGLDAVAALPELERSLLHASEVRLTPAEYNAPLEGEEQCHRCSETWQAENIHYCFGCKHYFCYHCDCRCE